MAVPMAGTGTSLARLVNPSAQPEELVSIIDNFQGLYGFPDPASVAAQSRQITPFVLQLIVTQGIIPTLVQTAVTGWPEDGNLAASDHPYDQVISASTAATQHEYDPPEANRGGSRPGPKWRSPRRTAIVCLANMAQSGAYVAAMEAAGLFESDALPAMLESSFAHVDYDLHNKGWEYLHAQDQTQTVVVALLELAAHALQHSGNSWECQQHTAVSICQRYQDPFAVQIDKWCTEREQLRSQCCSMRWNKQRTDAAVAELKATQAAQQQLLASHGDWFEQGGLDYNFVAFFREYLKGCSDRDKLTLVNRGLLTKLKGSLQNDMRPDRPFPLIEGLEALWGKSMQAASLDIYQEEVLAIEAQAEPLRQKGDEAFQAGQLLNAVHYYWQAILKKPEDIDLLNTISYTDLKLGDVQQAFLAAEEAMRLDLAVSKTWRRYGDALTAAKRWQLAHLAYTCACELAQEDADIKAMKAHMKEARSQLETVWSWDDVPHLKKGSVSGPAAWMGITQPLAVTRFSREVSGEVPPRLTIVATSRYHAMIMKKWYVDALAQAVASGKLRAAALPASCANLKSLDQLPQLQDAWGVTYHDTKWQHKRSRRPRFMVSVYSLVTREVRASVRSLNFGLLSVRQALLAAMLTPAEGAPGRPVSVRVHYRLFPFMHVACGICHPLGIEVTQESLPEAKQTAKLTETHFHGQDNEGHYQDEPDNTPLFIGLPDPNNGHLRRDEFPWRKALVGMLALAVVGAAAAALAKWVGWWVAGSVAVLLLVALVAMAPAAGEP